MEPPSVIAIGTTDLVVGVLDREQLNTALVALHRAGFGAHARVFDPARGDLRGQLARANLARFVAADSLASDGAIVAVVAPGRTATVADTLLRHGARDVRAVSRAAAPAAAGQAPATVGIDSIVAADATADRQ